MQASAALSHPINSAFWEPELGGVASIVLGLSKSHGVGILPIEAFVADPSVAPRLFLDRFSLARIAKA